MKKRFLLAGAALLLLLSLCPAAFGYSPAIRDIDITVSLAQDGTAHVQEVWDVTVASGTEWYLSMRNMDGKEVSDLAVHDESGTPYLNEGNWDVNRTIEEKAGRCGIVTKSDGYELCWGVGSYGDHVFTVSYTISDFVTAYDDADGFNHQFVTYDLSSNPQHVRVAISKENTTLTSEDTRVWAFGFKGEVWVTDGSVVSENDQGAPFRSNSYMNVMVQFNKGMFTPSAVRSGTFEDVRERAMEGSDYPDRNEDVGGDSGSHALNRWDKIITTAVIILSVVFPIGLVVVIVISMRSVSKHSPARPAFSISRAEKENAPYCRDLPFGGSLPLTYEAMKTLGMGDGEGALVGAYLLRWIQTGAVHMEECVKRGIFSSNAVPSVVLADEVPYFDDKLELRLYHILFDAAGDDHILQEKEFYKWCKRHYDKVDSWVSSVGGSARNQMLRRGDAQMVPYTSFFGLVHGEKQEYNEQGRQHMLEMVGFRRYLKDYTIINKRYAEEVSLWDEYLVFATLFGIADQVEKQFKKLYPQYFEQFAPNAQYGSSYMDFYMGLAFSRSISMAAARGADAGRSAASSSSSSFSGGGGFSSSGGGGGFSGGGGGGGSR